MSGVIAIEAASDDASRREAYAEALADVAPDDAAAVAVLRRAFLEARDEASSPELDREPTTAATDHGPVEEARSRRVEKMQRRNKRRRIFWVVILSLWALKLVLWKTL